MAQQEIVALTDDIDGGKAHETVAFGLDGVTYEIDLHNKKAAALRKSLADFVSAARHIRAESPFAQTDRRFGAGSVPHVASQLTGQPDSRQSHGFPFPRGAAGDQQGSCASFTGSAT